MSQLKNSRVCVVGGSKPESTEEASRQEATDVATGHVAAEKVR